MTLQMKSRGTVIDEWITAGLKYEHTPSAENRRRLEALGTLVIELHTEDELRKIESLVEELSHELAECWRAQEIIMEYRTTNLSSLSYAALQKLGAAAILAQVTNGRRNQYVRQIDSLLGDEFSTPLKKSYMG